MWNLAPYIRNILLYESSFRSVPAKNKPYSRKNLVSENHIRGWQCIALDFKDDKIATQFGHVLPCDWYEDLNSIALTTSTSI